MSAKQPTASGPIAATGDSSHCSLAPTGQLAQRTLPAPGPSGTTSRSYELYVPHGLASGSYVPLLVSLHGLGAIRSIQSWTTGGATFADRQASVLLSQGLDDGIIHPDQLGFPAFETWGRRYSCNPPVALITAAQQLAACRANVAVAWMLIQGFGHVTWSCPADKSWHNRGIWTFLTKRVAPTSTICS